MAFYYRLTVFACVWYFRRTLFDSLRIDMIDPDYGFTAFGPLGGVFVLGVGMLVLGIPLMLLCFAFGTKNFFAARTLHAGTDVHVSDTP